LSDEQEGAYLLVCGGTDVCLQWLTPRFELVRYGDVVTEQAIARHFPAHYSCQYRASVQTDAHLSTHNIHIAITMHIRNTYYPTLTELSGFHRGVRSGCDVSSDTVQFFRWLSAFGGIFCCLLS